MQLPLREKAALLLSDSLVSRRLAPVEECTPPETTPLLDSFAQILRDFAIMGDEQIG